MVTERKGLPSMSTTSGTSLLRSSSLPLNDFTPLFSAVAKVTLTAAAITASSLKPFRATVQRSASAIAPAALAFDLLTMARESLIAASITLLLVCPSANPSAASMTRLACPSFSRCMTMRQHATANSRNFRSLVLSPRSSSIGLGSVQASHSASVTAFTPRRGRSRNHQRRE